MPTITGTLIAHDCDLGDLGFSGFVVTADYQAPLPADGRRPKDADLLPAQASGVADAGGDFAIALLDTASDGAGVLLSVRAPNGATVAYDQLDGIPADAIEVAVTGVQRPAITPSDDPTLGRAQRLTGRVMDREGHGAPAGVAVVVWAVPEDGEESSAYPLLAATTAAGGYFSEAWPADVVGRAFGVVGGGTPVPVPLAADHRLPTSVVLVVDELPQPASAEHDGCACGDTPPRAPDQVDLASNPEAFSADLGGGRCVDFTVPNRAVEEVTFHCVVRTSEPEIQGLTLEPPTLIPPKLGQKLIEAARDGIAMIAESRTAPQITETKRFIALGRGLDAAGEPSTVEREHHIAASLLDQGAVALDADVLAERTRGGTLTPSILADVHRASLVKQLGQLVGALAGAPAGRVSLDADHAIDWDDTPTIYQATTIAHGHLLTCKQVWRADGYSLGDLLYSLPLAPGQKKQLAIVDWERQETAIRQAARTETEQLAADLQHDRDISQIIDSSLRENIRAHSEANTSAVAGGIGGFIGPVVFGVAGGYSNASSSAWQTSARDVSGSTLSQMRDRTMQSAGAVRSQRVTVVQTARQGESLRAQTEVVANYNHCHAITVEYFEVLRHFQVSHEVAAVQECLFIPMQVTPFTPDKALRWRHPLAAALRKPSLAGGFDALQRVSTGWADADVPTDRYADEAITYLDGELQMRFTLPRPADNDDDTYNAAEWGPYIPWLSQPPEQVWNEYLGTVMPDQRDHVWSTRLAPRVADRLLQTLSVDLLLDHDTSSVPVSLDTTLVSSFAQDQPLLVSLRPDVTTTSVVRARVSGVRFSVSGTVPADAQMMIVSGAMRYRTDHLAHDLFRDTQILNDLSGTDTVEVPVGLDAVEKRNPRKLDARLADTLVDHLNEHVEYYHQAIWRAMHPNRRYMLLDGLIAPNSGGRSLASCVENTLIGIVGNCLVMPVAPGLHLDPGYAQDPEHPVDLLNAYATDPPPPIRVSVPTRGVFAEAVMGACNACEEKDDTRFWRWEESPDPDQPPALLPVSTSSRRTTPADTTPDQFPAPIVAMQNVPKAPDPTGLAAAMNLIGTPNLFRDLTGLDLNQQNAINAFKGAMQTAQFFGGEGAKLAQQNYLNNDMDRNLRRIRDARDQGLITDDQARDLTASAFAGATGAPRPSGARPTDTPAVQRAIQRATASDEGSVRVSRPTGTVEVSHGAAATPADTFDVDPPVTPIAQPTPDVCWAAGGAMMLAWHDRSAVTPAAAATRAGASWKAKFDADQALTVAETASFNGALGLSAEAPLCYTARGLLRLLQTHGPLWIVGDDAVANNNLAHVRIVTGVSNAGDDTAARIRFVDPADGAAHELSYLDFAGIMEASDPARTGLGVYHW